MSLNGLDNPAVIEAYQTTLAEAGGWFLLKYVSRDEIALLGRGTGGVPEVVLRYMPEGLSRLIQARTTVQFQSILDKFSPHDTVFSLAQPSDLTESALSSACLLHAASGSITSSSSSLRRRRLMEITEDAEENATAKDEAPPQSPESGIRQRSFSQLSEATVVPSRSAESSPNIDGTPPALKEAIEPPADDRLPSTPEHAPELSSPRKNLLEELSQHSYEPRKSSQSARPSRRDLEQVAGYSPKVKRGPRPSLDTNGRPRTAGNLSRSQDQRPVASLPAGVRSSSRKSVSEPSRPQSQRSAEGFMTGNGSPLVPPLLVPPPSIPISRPQLSPGAKSMSALSSSGMTPEKERLMKALQQRKKQMEKRAEQARRKQTAAEEQLFLERSEEAVIQLQLAHFSVKEYLTSGRVEKVFQASMTEISARACITRVCLTYMFYFGGKCPAEEIRGRFPLAQYSARYWIDHARHAESRKDVQESILQFLLNESEAYAAWGYLFDPDKPQAQDAPRSHMASPLYYASSGGLTYIVRLLLERGADVNAQDGHYGNALQAASLKGHETIVQMLLEKGADVNAQGGRHGNALQAASYRRHEKIVQMLLEKGANANAQGGEHGNALQAASFQGHEKIVQMLLEKGANVNAQGGHYGGAVPWFIEHGWDDRGQPRHYGNSLQAASFQGHEETVQLLLEKGANINAQGGYFGNALQAASFKGREQIVQMLLEKGADVNAQGGRDGNALHAASYRGDERIVQLLLEKGANPDSKDDDGRTPLMLSAANGHEGIMKLLLSNNVVDPDSKDRFGWSPLLAAATAGHVALVRLLVATISMDPGSKDMFGRTALTEVRRRGHSEITRLL
ncbi:hypothetical protein GB937_009852 [Aspergillus fischeri]|nr:hypothetical protein GB937_009852 [Aspergillus fischeri]